MKELGLMQVASSETEGMHYTYCSCQWDASNQQCFPRHTPLPSIHQAVYPVPLCLAVLLKETVSPLS